MCVLSMPTDGRVMEQRPPVTHRWRQGERRGRSPRQSAAAILKDCFRRIGPRTSAGLPTARKKARHFQSAALQRRARALAKEEKALAHRKRALARRPRAPGREAKALAKEEKALVRRARGLANEEKALARQERALARRTRGLAKEEKALATRAQAPPKRSASPRPPTPLRPAPLRGRRQDNPRPNHAQPGGMRFQSGAYPALPPSPGYLLAANSGMSIGSHSARILI